MRGLHLWATVLAFAALGLSPALTVAEPLPVYDGLMTFAPIDPSGPEEFSWRVELSEDQQLEGIDAEHARVYYPEGDHTAFTITAREAHDSAGVTVPTSLAVTGSDVITLSVHHRDGNPLAGGAPFAYPVSPGPGSLKIGPVHIITMPLEQSVQEMRERIERESPPAEVGVDPESLMRCFVPKLKGLSLRAAAALLRQSGCRLGSVSRRTGAGPGVRKVVGQAPQPRKILAVRTPVAVRLGT